MICLVQRRNRIHLFYIRRSGFLESEGLATSTTNIQLTAKLSSIALKRPGYWYGLGLCSSSDPMLPVFYGEEQVGNKRRVILHHMTATIVVS